MQTEYKKITLNSRLLITGIFLGILLLYGLRVHFRGEEKVFEFLGHTMGTQYKVKVHGYFKYSKNDIHLAIQKKLAEIDLTLSAFEPNSEVSKINKMDENIKIKLSPHLSKVVETSLHISEETDGIFDVTVGPLLSLWSGGPDKNDWIPSEIEVQYTMDRVGYKKLKYESGTLIKLVPNMKLDFSAIAKGYGLDQIGELLIKRGITNFRIEIGGEVLARGRNEKGEPWLAPLEIDQNFSLTQVTGEKNIFFNKPMAVAASGAYHHLLHYEKEKNYHIIDLRTGRPALSKVISAVVIAPSGMLANAYAMALLVMAHEAALTFIQAHKEIAVLLLVRNGDESLQTVMSENFKDYLEKKTFYF